MHKANTNISRGSFAAALFTLLVAIIIGIGTSASLVAASPAQAFSDEKADQAEQQAADQASNAIPFTDAASANAEAAGGAPSHASEDTSFAPQATPKIKATLSANQRVVTIQADGGAYDTAAEVRFAVWSVEGWQDDLRWYKANRLGNTWTYAITLSAHCSTGAFHVHGYATHNGRSAIVNACTFTVSAPHATVSFTQSAAEQNRGVGTITVTNVSCPAGVAEVLVPTWSLAGGQDDLVWHKAPYVGNGTWATTVSTLDAKRSAGLYDTHCYIVDGNGARTIAGATRTNITNGSVSMQAELTQDQKTLIVRASGGALNNATAVQFPTWSHAGGQDDLRWYKAWRSGSNWEYRIPISNHRTAGLYSIHAYATVENRTGIVGGTNVTVAAPKANITISQSQSQKDRGMFGVTVVVSSAPSGITRIQLPTWSSAGWQDDLVWYTRNGTSNTWTTEIPCVAAKRTAGEYHVHCYVSTGNGIYAIAGGTTGNVAITPTTSRVEVTNAQTATVVISGGIVANAQGVRFPTWSDQGWQDDLVWYQGTRQSDGSYAVNIPISRHHTAGRYQVHFYARINGAESIIGGTTFTIQAPSASSLTVTNVNNSAGTFTAVVSGINAPSGIASVRIPVWGGSNQGDLNWYTAWRQSDGSYVANISAKNHRSSEIYSIHCYVKCNNGVETIVGGINGSKVLSLSNYVSVFGKVGSGSRIVYIKNPTNASYVQVPVWSNAGGQDDVKWYNAAHQGGGLWAATIQAYNFKHAGTCTGHYYVNGQCVGAFTFGIHANELVPAKYRAMAAAVQGLTSNTSWLIATDTHNCCVGIFSGRQGAWTLVKYFDCAPGKASTPSRKGYFTIGSRGYVFGHGYSCYYFTQYSGNYLFHSIKYRQGTFNVMDGTMGRPASAGCIRLWIENAKWIHDYIPRGSKVWVY